jgi:hypothetical protein
MKRMAGFTAVLLALTAGFAFAITIDDEYAKRLTETTVFNCPAPINSVPSTYPLDNN